MKKLSKISLKDAVVLDDKQLKTVFGGSGSSNRCSDSCSGSCTVTSDLGSNSNAECRWILNKTKCVCAGVI